MRRLFTFLLALTLCLSLTVPALAAPFSDVSADTYYAQPIAWAAEQRITEGATTTTFNPDGLCTRGHIITFLWRTAGCPASTGISLFSNVSRDRYYTDALRWAVQEGIADSSVSLRPDAPCTRAEAVTFLWRYAGSPGVAVTDRFADVPAGAGCAQAVEWALENGVTNGRTETMFAPGDTCTRANIVTFLWRNLAGQTDNAPACPADTPAPPVDTQIPPANTPDTPAETPSIPTEAPDTPTEEPNTPAETPDTPPDTPATPTENDYAAEVVRLVNIERAKEGLSALTMDERLCQAALIRAAEIGKYFSHTRPDGTSCFTVLKELGISYSYCGENIAGGQRTPAAVVEGWMNSPGHRANIMSANFSKIGVGYLPSGGYGTSWVQLFTS